jgi:signal transduction histidine kinase
MNRESASYWRRIIAGNIIASLFVVFAFSGATFRSPIGQVARAFGIAFLYSSIIGPMLGFVMPQISPWIWVRTRFPFNWIVVMGAMAVLAMAGTFAAVGVLRVVGVVEPGQVGSWIQGSTRIAIVVTLVIGLFITAYEVMRARLAQATAEAQLAALESRVQPHFLFNTLNSISALIHDDPQGAERMTGQLASLLRSSLDQQSFPLVPLEDELKTVRDYLAIEQVRFGSRLRYDIVVADGIGDSRVPRLAVQTMVENSVKYAVAPRREGATIRVTAADGRSAIHVDVQDDGPGFDASSLPAGHGLALLRDRVALLFPDTGSMTVRSAPTGTNVSLTLPRTHDRPAFLSRATD